MYIICHLAHGINQIVIYAVRYVKHLVRWTVYQFSLMCAEVDQKCNFLLRMCASHVYLQSYGMFCHAMRIPPNQRAQAGQ